MCHVFLLALVLLDTDWLTSERMHRYGEGESKREGEREGGREIEAQGGEDGDSDKSEKAQESA